MLPPRGAGLGAPPGADIVIGRCGKLQNTLCDDINDCTRWTMINEGRDEVVEGGIPG
jgi:hypothetical protein